MDALIYPGRSHFLEWLLQICRTDEATQGETSSRKSP